MRRVQHAQPELTRRTVQVNLGFGNDFRAFLGLNVSPAILRRQVDH
jgi:hypothetical protein